MDTSANGTLLDHLDQAGWEVAGWGNQGIPWVFRRDGEQREVVAPTLIVAIRLLLDQDADTAPHAEAHPTPR